MTQSATMVFGAMVSCTLSYHLYHILRLKTARKRLLLINAVSLNQGKNYAAVTFANSEQKLLAPMSYHAPTTYAMNRQDRVNIPQLTASHQMILAPQINALRLLAGANSVVVHCWIRGQALSDSILPI